MSPPSEKTNLGNESQRQGARGENANDPSGWLYSGAMATHPGSDSGGTGICELCWGNQGIREPLLATSSLLQVCLLGETQAAVHIAQLRILPLPPRISERKFNPCVWDRFLLTHHNADALLRGGLSWLLFALTLTWEVLDQPQGSEGLGEPVHGDLGEAPALGPPTLWLHSGFNCPPAPASQPSALKHKHLLHIIPLLQNLQ